MFHLLSQLLNFSAYAGDSSNAPAAAVAPLVAGAANQAANHPLTQSAANAPSPLASLIPFVLIFLVFYFLMIRPQKKKAQQEEAMLAALNKGDEVYTRSGILGTIYGLNETIVTLEIAESVKIKVIRTQIAGSAKKLFEKDEKK
jgi:preprotein translocase subunit YajC